MKEEEITALAREYAEESANEVGVKFDPQDWACTNCAIEAKNVIKFLLRRFCLVEKERVKDEYNKTLEEAKLAHPKHQIQNRTRMRLLKSLFPEIAKEVEE